MTVSGPYEEAGPADPSPGAAAAAQDGAPAAAPRHAEPVHVDFPPVENGVDYLRSVVDHLTAADPPASRDLKYAVLHLQAAAEVLLKARLAHEHWSLVFKDPGKATRKKFEEGDFISCTTEAAVERLRNVAGVAVNDKGARALDALAKTRNSLQHYGLTMPARAVEARAAEVLDFLLDFIHTELALTGPVDFCGESITEAEQELAYVRARLSTIQSFLKRRHDQLRPELEKVRDITTQCPLCTQWAVVLGSGTDPLSCRFCHHGWLSAELAAADNGLAQTAQGVEVAQCPDCCEDALLKGIATVASAPAHRHSLCFACGTAFDVLNTCDSCEQLYSPNEDNDLGLCSDCLGARIDRF
ncbi:hypothetical protein GCM10010277_68720 [Streptomyces longisporoflavus]|uniref:hypothetical protein n=1 Tax=Streptomyces longisporoflavus TaxID=28044 RepID=UPI00167D5A18|nr:hypothetical protein [Streptomyces longisporoflavus]GGV62973.1 hypothetical protein GCM10010277_68720 [Streptomyces longisporoflavus]